MSLLAALAAAAASSGSPLSIPIEIEQNLVLAKVIVGKSAPLTFIVDTGAEASVIAADRLQEAGLGQGTHGAASVQGGEVDMQSFAKVPVRVGPLSLGKIDISAVDLASLSAGTGRRIDGILGYDLFRGRTVTIDYARHRVRIGARPAGPAIALPIAIRGRTPFVQAEVVQGKARANGRFLIDTGALGSINLGARFVAAHRAIVPRHTLALTGGAILAGQFVTRAGQLSAFRAGSWTARQVPTNFSMNADADDLAAGDAGLIGGQILSRYRITFDYRAGRMWLSPGPAVSAPLRFDCSGLSLTSLAPDYRRKLVRLVLQGTPAAEGGIEKGDELVAVGDQPASRLKLAEIRDLLRKPGQLLRLTFQRGDRTFEATVKTRDLL